MGKKKRRGRLTARRMWISSLEDNIGGMGKGGKGEGEKDGRPMKYARSMRFSSLLFPFLSFPFSLFLIQLYSPH